MTMSSLIAECDPSFSAMNHIGQKSNLQTSNSEESLVSHMGVCNSPVDLTTFDPEPPLQCWVKSNKIMWKPFGKCGIAGSLLKQGSA